MARPAIRVRRGKPDAMTGRMLERFAEPGGIQDGTRCVIDVSSFDSGLDGSQVRSPRWTCPLDEKMATLAAGQ